MDKTVKDFLSGILFFSFGVFVLILLPSQIMGEGAYGEDVGPDFIPKVMALAMIIFSTLLIIKSVIKKEFRDAVKLLRFKLPPIEIPAVILLITAWVCSLFYVNYLVVTIPFVMLSLALFKNKKKSTYIIAVGFVLLLFVVFRFLLNVRLP
ncbi:MAG: tripartite tricarboxylate transporter TctB family protein [Spirochaetaceae bacterium]